MSSLLAADQIPEIANAWAYVWASWAITLVVIGGYAWSVVRKGRQLSSRVPKDQRRWM